MKVGLTGISSALIRFSYHSMSMVKDSAVRISANLFPFLVSGVSSGAEKVTTYLRGGEKGLAKNFLKNLSAMENCVLMNIFQEHKNS